MTLEDPNKIQPTVENPEKKDEAIVNPESTVDSPKQFNLETNTDYLDFQKVEVTKVDESKPWKPPLEVTVTKADGTKVEGVDANLPFFSFKSPTENGVDLTVSAAAAGHIDELHIKGTEPGSRFNYGNLKELFEDVKSKLPEVVSTEKGVSAFDIDMGKSMGKEGIASIGELVKDGTVSAEEFMDMEGIKSKVLELNKAGSPEQKEAFVTAYKNEHSKSKVQFQLVRGAVLIPTVDAPKRETTKLFMVFGPDGKEGKTLYTTAPGRNMPRHPNPHNIKMLRE